MSNKDLMRYESKETDCISLLKACGNRIETTFGMCSLRMVGSVAGNEQKELQVRLIFSGRDRNT